MPVSQGLAALMILPLGWYLWSLPPTLAADGRLMRLGGSSEQEHFSDVTDAVQIISALSAPGDFVLTDHPYLALLAQRLVPPPLGDPSKTRVRARELTGADIAAAATEYPSKLAVLWSDRFLTLRAFRNWLEERYQPAKIYGRKGDSGRFIYIRKDADLAAARAVMTASLEQRSGAEFAGELRLGRFGLADSLIKRGDTTALELEWVAVKQLTADYHVIFKLVGPDGRVWDDEERSLFGRGEGADDWAPGRWVVQVTTIAPPEEAPSGEYRVIVGLYDSARRQSATLSTAPSGPHGFSERELLLAVLRVE